MPPSLPALLLLVGYALALSQGHLQLASLPTLLGLATLAWGARHPDARLRTLAHGGFILTGAALAAHALPGFDNAIIIDHAQLSPGALPYTLELNLDKPLIGLWLLLACPWLGLKAHRAHGLVWLAPLTCLGIPALALLTGVSAWAPKWPPGAGWWLANNLVLVSVTEELLFRGYVLGGLQRWVAPGWALALSSGLFGMAHLALGPLWAALATLAGWGYGVAYQRGGLTAAIALHAGLNVVHFTLLTYPALQAG